MPPRRVAAVYDWKREAARAAGALNVNNFSLLTGMETFGARGFLSQILAEGFCTDMAFKSESSCQFISHPQTFLELQLRFKV